MKQTGFLLFTFFLLMISCYAQETSQDVRLVLNKQIADAKKKNTVQVNSTQTPRKVKKSSISTVPNPVKQIVVKSEESKNSNTVVIFMVVNIALIFTVGIVIFRRSDFGTKIFDRKKNKTSPHFRMIEVPDTPENRVKIMRKSIKYSSGLKELSEEKITDAARELSMSKTEFLLAKKIRALELLKV